MAKFLAVLAVFWALLFWSPCVAEDQQSQIHAQKNVSSRNQQLVPPMHVIIDRPPPVEQSRSDAESAKTTEEKLLPRFLRPEWVIVYITAVYVIISAITFWAIRRQARLMDGQLREMKQSREIETKTLILQYRPKIIVRDARASNFNVAELGQPAQGKVRLAIINTGGSPAHIVGGWIALWSAVSPIASQMGINNGDEGAIGNFTLQPGEDTSVEVLLTAGVTNDVQWANFHQGLSTEPLRYIYLVGMMRYTDELGITRRTGISRTYDPKTTAFTPSGSEGEYND
jgi:Ca2+/Na+ antiporter